MKIRYRVLAMVLATIFLLNTSVMALASEVYTLSSSTTNASVEHINNSTYSVNIPAAIHAGDLSPTDENIVGYSIFVDNYDISAGQVTIKASDNAVLVHGTDNSQKLSVSNEFQQTTIIEDRTVNGELSINPNEVRTSMEGEYSGTITFEFEYQSFHSDDVEQPQFNWESVEDASSNTTSTAVTGGIFDYTEQLEQGTTVQIVFNQINEEDSNISSNLETYFDDKDLSDINDSNAQALDEKNKFIEETYSNAKLEYFYSINIVETSSSGDKSLVEDLKESVIELQIGYKSDMVGAGQKVIVLREHNGVIAAFEELTSKPSDYIDGTFYVGEEYIYIYSSQFSVYSIGVADDDDTDVEPELDTNPNPNPEPDTDTNPNPEPDTDTNPNPEPDTDTNPNPEPDTDSNPNPEPDTDTNPEPEILEDLPDGEYTANVSMLKYYTPTEYSMCHVMFYETANVEVKGDNAKLTLYVLDPIPNFPDDGTPISEVRFIYDEQEYPATVSEYSEKKYFEADGFAVSEAGDYTVATVTVTVPKTAILEAYQPILECAVYVNAVMKSDQSFWTVLEIEGVTGDAELPEEDGDNNEDSSGGNSSGGSSSGGNSSGGSSSGGNSSGGDSSDEDSWENDSDITELTDGSYTADVTMLQYYDTSLASMCDVLFYKTADIEVSGDDAELTLYVVDPIPNFSSFGTPISDVWFEYEEQKYTATVSSHKETKYFEADGSFISEDGEYSVSTLKVTVPKAAILEAYKPSLVCSPYVDAVMMSRQQFWVILEIEGISGEAELPETDSDGESSGGSSSGGSSSGGSSSGGSTSGGSTTGESTSGGSTSGSGSTVTELNDGTYTADVTMLQYYNTSLASMCDVLFYNKADIEVSGDNVKLTLYVIDPIPNFASYGTPISDIWFEYGGTEYAATVSSYSGTKYFDADGSFISDAGNYAVSTLTVTLPKAAILEAYQPSLVCSPYVDAVMMSRQQFYVILEVDGVTDGMASSGTGTSGNADEELYTDGELNDVSQEGTYRAAVEFKKEMDFASFSMCDTLFYSYSDIIIKDDMATVVLYIIDPIPGYEEYGTPITDVTFEYDGVTYIANVDTSDQMEQYFPLDDRFIFESADYLTSRIVVTIPAEAIETSPNATLKCTGFVNAVMNTYQTFYVVFSELEWLSDSTDGILNTNMQSDVLTENMDTESMESGNEALTINSVTINGSSMFVWSLLGIIILTVVAFIGYYTYKRRN